MMSFANQTPAFDSVRINIGGNAPVLPDAPAPGLRPTLRPTPRRRHDAQAQEAGQAPDQDGAAQLAGVETAAPAPADESAAPADAGSGRRVLGSGQRGQPAATDDGEGNENAADRWVDPRRTV